MATDAQNIATIRSNLLASLATESASPKPSYSIDGQSVDWNGYRKAITQQIKDLDELLAASQGPIEEIVQGST